jgi:hypothetical protein
MTQIEKYRMQSGGRVKLAGGSVDTYYRCAEPMTSNCPGGALDTANNFKALREKPPLSLLMAFFPDDSHSIKARLRGAGLYRHLRMDQGPGGNFTEFQLSENPVKLKYELTTEQGFAMLEHVVQDQMSTGQFGCVVPLICDIQSSFQQNDYRRTSQLVEQFKIVCTQASLVLPDGDHTGSKSGFFFIRPTETNSPVEFSTTLIPEVKKRVRAALTAPESLAEYARKYILTGSSYQDALTLVAKTLKERGHTDYSGSGLLYFQPDCIVSNDGSVEVEKVNMPDVGFFLTQLDTQGNHPLEQVVKVNNRLRDELTSVLDKQFPCQHITLVTRDEVLSARSDTLELLEIQALRQSLQKLGKAVAVVGISDSATLSSKTQVLMLNTYTESPAYAELVNKVVKEKIVCFPDPLLKAFQEKATTLKRIEVSGKRLNTFLNLIKPKDINESNAERLHMEIGKYLDMAGITDDILYISFEGLRTPVPVFQYSLHSFFQIYNAIERETKNGRKVDSIVISPVPFSRNSAVFRGSDGPRLAAFRFMFTQE